DAEVDPHYDRCQYFIIVDAETLDFEVIDNTDAIASAQIIANKGTQALLIGHCSPNAYQALEIAGLQVVTGVMGAVMDVIREYKAGRWQAASQPSADTYFDIGMSGGIECGICNGMIPLQPAKDLSSNFAQGADTFDSQFRMMVQQLNELQRGIENIEEEQQ
ncbi:NifB/NifX family molybdenum-iron cluster-binding protein, partial [Chloroflexota bacterium]